MTPMQLGVAAETQVFLLSCLAGAGLGAVYDCLRVFRTAVKHNKAMLFIEDFVYALFFGFIYFIFGAAQTGQLRFFTFVGMTIGALLERIVLGNIVVSAVNAVTSFIWRIFISPAAGFIAKIALFIKSAFVKKYPKFHKSKKNAQKVLKV